MILSMAKVRVLGPRNRLAETIAALQDLGTVHLADPDPVPPLERYRPSDREERHREQLREGLADVEGILERLPADAFERPEIEASGGPPGLERLAAWIRSAGRLRREVRSLEERRAVRERQREELERYARFFDVFEAMEAGTVGPTEVRAHHLVLEEGGEEAVERLRAGLAETIGDEFELLSRPVPGGAPA